MSPPLLAAVVAGLSSLAATVVGLIFYGYGIQRDRIQAAKAREADMRASIQRLADSIDTLRAATQEGFQKMREAYLEDQIANLREERGPRR